MDTHDVHQTQYPSALRKKPFRLADLPAPHVFAFEDDASSRASRLPDRRQLQDGQYFSNPSGCTLPLTDSIPHRSDSELPTTSSPEATIPSLATVSSTGTISTTSLSEAVATQVDNLGTTSSTTATENATTSISKNDGHSSNTGPLIGGIIAGTIALAFLVIPLVWCFRQRQRERLANVVTPFNPNEPRRYTFLSDDTKDNAVAASQRNRGPTFNCKATNAALSMDMRTRNTTLRPSCMITSKPRRTYAAAGQGFNSKSMRRAPRQLVYPNLQNPFMTPAERYEYAPRLQSPFPPHRIRRIPVPQAASSELEAVVAGGGRARKVPTRPKQFTKGSLYTSNPKAVSFSLRVVNGSAATTEEGNERTEDVFPTWVDGEMPRDDYVDISRSSISSFQASQYEEISRRLNIDVPKGLRNTIAEDYFSIGDRDLHPVPAPMFDA